MTYKDSLKCVQFVGPAAGHQGQYSFFRAFRFCQPERLADEILSGKKVVGARSRVLSVGQFFFVRISPEDDPCIGELQMLWYDSQTNQSLSSVRLYFLPEQTPEGRRHHHGEHEVLAASEKLVLRLEDLGQWITDQVEWSHGLLAPTCPPPLSKSKSSSELKPECHTELPEVKRIENCHDSIETRIEEKPRPAIYPVKLAIPSDEDEVEEDGRSASVVILSYPHYCRYRAILCRLGHMIDKWLRNSLIAALGGFAAPSCNTRVLFCKETFDHDGLFQNELNCEHLSPSIKNRPKKKPNKVSGRTSPGSESVTSDESKDNINTAKMIQESPIEKKKLCKDEQEFLQKLFKFMQDRNTPINRVPHLGFKQIDLYFFYMYAQRLGGYNNVTCKKMWKHVYDEMGGNPGSTSAATCTRRHYERLLLPFENHINGEDHKNIIIKEEDLKDISGDESEDEVLITSYIGADGDASRNGSIIEHGIRSPDDLEMIVEDGENYENKDRIHNNATVEENQCSNDSDVPLSRLPMMLAPKATPQFDSNLMRKISTSSNCYSGDQNSKNLLQSKENEQNNIDPVTKMTLLQKKQRVRDNTFSEKERRWNEIRKKNAMQRTGSRKGPPLPLQSRYVDYTKAKSEDDCIKCIKEAQELNHQRTSNSCSPASLDSPYYPNRYSVPVPPVQDPYKTEPTSALPSAKAYKSSERFENPRFSRNSLRVSHQKVRNQPSSVQSKMFSLDNNYCYLPYSSMTKDIKPEICSDRSPSPNCNPRPSVIQHTEEIQSPTSPVPGASHPLPAHLSSTIVTSPQHSSHLQKQYHRGYPSRSFEYQQLKQFDKMSTSSQLKAPDIYAISESRTIHSDSRPVTCKTSQHSYLATPPHGITAQSYYYQHRQSPVEMKPPRLSDHPRKFQTFDKSAYDSQPRTNSLPSTVPSPAPSYSKVTSSWPSETCAASQVLDLSMKRKSECLRKSDSSLLPAAGPTSVLPINEEGCLDLSVKKPKLITNPPNTPILVDLTDEARGIENVTPPSPVNIALQTINPIKTPLSSLTLLRTCSLEKNQSLYSANKSPHFLESRSQFEPSLMGSARGIPSRTGSANSFHSESSETSWDHNHQFKRISAHRANPTDTKPVSPYETLEQGLVQVPITMSNQIYPLLYKYGQPYGK